MYCLKLSKVFGRLLFLAKGGLRRLLSLAKGTKLTHNLRGHFIDNVKPVNNIRLSNILDNLLD